MKILDHSKIALFRSTPPSPLGLAGGGGTKGIGLGGALGFCIGGVTLPGL